jgi:hypothetical protein
MASAEGGAVSEFDVSARLSTLVPGGVEVLSVTFAPEAVGWVQKERSCAELRYGVGQDVVLAVGSDVPVGWRCPTTHETAVGSGRVEERGGIDGAEVYRVRLQRNGPDWLAARERQPLAPASRYYVLPMSRVDAKRCELAPSAAGSRAKRMDVALRSLSEDGCGVMVTPEHEEAWAFHREGDLRLHLVGMQEPLDLHGSIVHRKLTTHGVAYEIRFQFERNPMDLRRQSALRSSLVEIERRRIAKD